MVLIPVAKGLHLAIDQSGFDPGVRLDGRRVTVVGAGIVGLWQAAVLAEAGAAVMLIEREGAPFIGGASRLGAAMIAPDCEAEGQPAALRTLAHEGLGLWQKADLGLSTRGTLVVAHGRDLRELDRYARDTQGHTWLQGVALRSLEPDLSDRFSRALYFANEAHISAGQACSGLMSACEKRNVKFQFNCDESALDRNTDCIIDCRGYAASADLPDLRPVRGERLVVEARDVSLSRPVRLLHPRQSLYIVPQGEGRYVIGATVIESGNQGPMTVKSALDLLSAAYSIDGRFSEAAILDMGAALRPAFSNNMPKILIDDAHAPILRVNGVYRHGFMLAPVLAMAVAKYIFDGTQNALFA